MPPARLLVNMNPPKLSVLTAAETLPRVHHTNVIVEQHVSLPPLDARANSSVVECRFNSFSHLLAFVFRNPVKSYECFVENCSLARPVLMIP